MAQDVKLPPNDARLMGRGRPYGDLSLDALPPADAAVAQETDNTDNQEERGYSRSIMGVFAGLLASHGQRLDQITIQDGNALLDKLNGPRPPSSSPSSGPTNGTPYRANYATLHLSQAALDNSAVLKVAATHVGQSASGDRKDLTEFLSKNAGRVVDPTAEAWCADFTKAVLSDAGLSTRGTNALASSFRTYGNEVKDAPRFGDVVVFNHHVGLFAGYENGSVLVLGGNQKGEVNVERFSADRVETIRRPPGAETLDANNRSGPATTAVASAKAPPTKSALTAGA